MTMVKLNQSDKIGILAGGGDLPVMVATACEKIDIPYVMVSFEGQPQPTGADLLDKAKRHILPLGKVGKTLALFKKAGVTRVVMIGNLEKPSLFSLKPDWKGAQILTKLALHHDDSLLRAVANVIEVEDMKVCGIHELLPELMMPVGQIGKHKPSKDMEEDIQIGWRIAKVVGAEDIGQAVVVKNRVVLGVEGVEGTDKLIERCADLRGSDNSGATLIKVAKPQQDLRFDMPSIGPKTIRRLVDKKYSGLIVESGHALFVHAEECKRIADENGLFIVGVDVIEEL